MKRYTRSMANPELLLQSLKGYQERQQTAQRERIRL